MSAACLRLGRLRPLLRAPRRRQRRRVPPKAHAGRRIDCKPDGPAHNACRRQRQKPNARSLDAGNKLSSIADLRFFLYPKPPRGRSPIFTEASKGDRSARPAFRSARRGTAPGIPGRPGTASICAPRIATRLFGDVTHPAPARAAGRRRSDLHVPHQRNPLPRPAARITRHPGALPDPPAARANAGRSRRPGGRGRHRG